MLTMTNPDWGDAGGLRLCKLERASAWRSGAVLRFASVRAPALPTCYLLPATVYLVEGLTVRTSPG